MENKYFNINDSVYDITEKYEEVKDKLISLGFDSLKDDKLRKMIGQNISLEAALKTKKISVDTFVEQVVSDIEERINQVDKDLVKKQEKNNGDVKVEGILPCPVRIPLMEAFEKWMNDNEDKLEFNIAHELKAASMGVDWLKSSLEEADSVESLSDLFISAGFDLFFDKNLIGKFKEDFVDITGFESYNEDFENDYIKLKDPDGQYSMIGVVPAVFLVNQEELGDKPLPKSWKDLLSEEYENRVSLPIGDFDLFNAILLNIYKNYGEEGVRKLGKSLLKSMHPSEMVKSHIKKSEKPTVTIMPYFFTKMTKRGGPMVAIWPEDGAIISPIFMLSKKSKAEKLKPVVDFFASKEVGEILSHNGKFPSVHPEVNNMIAKDHKYMWLGWDTIKNNDIGKLINHCEEIFNEAVKGE